MTRCQDAAPQFIPASSTTAGSPTPAFTRRTTLRPGTASAVTTRLPGHVVQDPGIGEVAGVHDMTVPDTDDLDGRRGERPARRGHGPRRPHLGDYHLRI